MFTTCALFASRKLLQLCSCNGMDEPCDLKAFGSEKKLIEMEETTYPPVGSSARFVPPTAPEGFHMWQHKKSRILHLMDDHSRIVFACGRSSGPFHTKEGLNPRYDTPICWSCFNKARQ